MPFYHKASPFATHLLPCKPRNLKLNAWREPTWNSPLDPPGALLYDREDLAWAYLPWWPSVNDNKWTPPSHHQHRPRLWCQGAQFLIDFVYFCFPSHTTNGDLSVRTSGFPINARNDINCLVCYRLSVSLSLYSKRRLLSYNTTRLTVD